MLFIKKKVKKRQYGAFLTTAMTNWHCVHEHVYVLVGIIFIIIDI